MILRLKGAALRQPDEEALYLCGSQRKIIFLVGYKMSGECDKCGEHCLDCRCELLCRSRENGHDMNMQWISVHDMLPHDEGDYLTLIDNGFNYSQVVQRYYINPEKSIYVDIELPYWELIQYRDRITHWMPLPEPPNQRI